MIALYPGRSTRAIAALALVCCGCDAFLGDGPLRPGPADSDDPILTGSEPLECEAELGPPIVRRLTARQLRASVEDLFADPGAPRADVLTDPVVLGFTADARQAVVRGLQAQQLMTYAEEVARWAVQTKLGELARCTAHEAVCWRMFIESFGRRVYREPVPDASVAAYEAMFAAEPSFAAGAEAVIAAMLQSPYFLYRREIGGAERSPDREVALTPYEVASNLSYLLTGSAPDEALLDAAAAGRLETDADLDREIDRGLASPRGRDTLRLFLREWLEIDDLPSRAKDPAQVEFTAEVRGAMLRESEALFLDVFAAGGGVRELLGARHTFLDEPLARFYGVPGVSGAELRRVELAGGPRAPGILGHGSVLARHALADSSSPVQRGILVRERLLCQELPAPPAGVDTNLRAPAGAVTTRERYAMHRESATCSGCHALMDPIGFALEHYDAFGRRREQEAGAPIDATGAIHDGPDGDVPLDGAESLTAYLAGSDAVRGCFARYLSYFAYGVDGCGRDAIRARIEGGDGSLRDVLRAIVHAPHFRRRAPER